MRVNLLYKDRDFNWEREDSLLDKEIIEDLDLDILWEVASSRDKDIRDCFRKVVMESLYTKEEILYRQSILEEFIRDRLTFDELEEISTLVYEELKKVWFYISDQPTLLVHRSVSILKIVLKSLESLKRLASKNLVSTKSEGLREFWERLEESLTKEFLSEVRELIETSQFKQGIEMSANLGSSTGVGYSVRVPLRDRGRWIKKALKIKKGESFKIADRDDAAFRALLDLKQRGLVGTARTLAQSIDNILHFFTTLRRELEFYRGGLRIYDTLTSKIMDITFPSIIDRKNTLSFSHHYNICLSLSSDNRVTTNEIELEDKELILITGANQGGKTTYIRGLAISQLLMQCGMFVGAKSFSTNIATGIFTHFIREEDESMSSGKLDEELSRMSTLISNIKRGAKIYLNESFASTNEREGSNISFEVTRALLESGIQIFSVTHLYEYAYRCFSMKESGHAFLKATRLADGSRSYKIASGDPDRTGFGMDLYRGIFKED